MLWAIFQLIQVNTLFLYLHSLLTQKAEGCCQFYILLPRLCVEIVKLMVPCFREDENCHLRSYQLPDTNMLKFTSFCGIFSNTIHYNRNSHVSQFISPSNQKNSLVWRTTRIKLIFLVMETFQLFSFIQ